MRAAGLDAAQTQGSGFQHAFSFCLKLFSHFTIKHLLTFQISFSTLSVSSRYVYWNLHEPQPGVYDFMGILNITAFLQAAMDAEMLIILRAGPYTDASIDFVCSEQPDNINDVINVRSHSSRFELKVYKRQYLYSCRYWFIGRFARLAAQRQCQCHRSHYGLQ